MNTKQLVVLWLGIAVIGVLTFYVPYIMHPSMVPGFDGITMINIRYGAIFAPPKGFMGIDWNRVIPYMVFVVVLTVGGMLTLSPKRTVS